MNPIINNILKPVQDFSWPGNTQESIILHTTLGNNYQGAHDTLKIRHLSYHFVIDEEGDVYQLVDIERSAWHSGVKSNPNLRARSFFGSDNPNKRSIGISFVRNGHLELTVAQRDAGVALIKNIGKETGIRYNRDNIFYHREITNNDIYSKPPEVEQYRMQIIEGLEGFKDEKDAGERSKLLLIIMILKQLIVALIKRNEQKDI